MHDLKHVFIENAQEITSMWKHKEGLDKEADRIANNWPCIAVVPWYTDQNRANNLSDGDLTSTRFTIPYLYEIINRLTKKCVNLFEVVSQMRIAKEADFQNDPEIEIESKPFRSMIDNVVYLTCSGTNLSVPVLTSFLNMDIGFERNLFVIDGKFSENWFLLNDENKSRSIVAVVCSAYDNESFLVLINPTYAKILQS